MVRRGSKNGYQKTLVKEIGLFAQNMTTILGSMVNIIGRGRINARPFYEHDNHFDINMIFL